ncbi:MAG: aspartate 1-decarboxylase [Candidatus Aminicenantes bacterium]|nr:aspartate 1-decarboxylase [Candidatus Aminicenantes bacterium]
MKRMMLKSKIHHARVTDKNVNYQGSITLNKDLIKQADLFPFEQVHVYNVSNGERFITYLIKEEKHPGVCCINGAAAHKVNKGDKLIIAAYSLMEDEEADFYSPRILILDENNQIKSG